MGFLLNFVYYLYNYYIVYILLSHSHHVANIEAFISPQILIALRSF